MLISSGSSLSSKKAKDPSDLSRYCLQENFSLTINESVYDLSGMEIDLSHIFRGGIGYGASASRLLANGMQSIESSDEVYNFPICIEGVLDVAEHYQKLQFISTSNEVMDLSDVRLKIQKVILSGQTILNIPLNLDGHASLISIVILKKKALLKFYESLPQKKLNYDKRYTSRLVDFIQALLPENMPLDKSFQVIPLLRQGEMSGGYYTLYAAHLLKEQKETRIFCATDASLPLFNETHDKQIRAELALRTLLAYGIEEAKETVENVEIFGKIEHIFQRLGRDYLPMIEDLKSRLNQR